MTSDARKKFDKNCQDVDRLLEIHGDLAKDTPGRKYGVEVLNKSAVVLITAFWEAYCEDIAAQAVGHIVTRASDSTAIPKALKKLIALEIGDNKHDLAAWELADDGWRAMLEGRLDDLQERRNRRLNTPKTENIDDLFESSIGLPTISKSWYWSGVSSKQAGEKLDRFVTLRGSIAHRGVGASSVTKKQVTDYLKLVKRLVGKTDGRVNTHLGKATGVTLF